MSYTSSTNFVMIVNGVGIPARIVPGIIADAHLGIFNTFFICLSATAIAMWCWLAVHSIPSYYLWTVFYGIFNAAFQSLFPSVIAVLSDDITKTGTRLGMAFTAIGFSALVGGPIAGALLKEADGWYGAPIIWASASTMVGTALVLWARAWKWGCGWRTRC